MIRRFKKTRNYHAPRAVVLPVEFEENFCTSNRFNVQVDELKNANSADGADDPGNGHYFEF